VTQLLSLLALTAVTAHSVQPGVVGSWENPSKSVVMKVADCHGHLCGTVVWASEKAKRDASKGTKHLVGSHLLTKVKQTDHNHWKGKIFVPDQNMTVSAKLAMVTHNQMKVSGCALMICKSQVWHRTHKAHA
jgi:uncharacterized protein (DUF2147 family)